MLNEPCWVSAEGAVRINQRLVGLTGEPHELRDLGLLESACARPQNRWAYEGDQDSVSLGCCLLFGIARNHPFLQGNKRTGFTAMIGFLGANGYRVVLGDDYRAAEAIIQVIENPALEPAFCDAFRQFVVPVRSWR